MSQSQNLPRKTDTNQNLTRPVVMGGNNVPENVPVSTPVPFKQQYINPQIDKNGVDVLPNTDSSHTISSNQLQGRPAPKAVGDNNIYFISSIVPENTRSTPAPSVTQILNSPVSASMAAAGGRPLETPVTRPSANTQLPYFVPSVTRSNPYLLDRQLPTTMIAATGGRSSVSLAWSTNVAVPSQLNSINCDIGPRMQGSPMESAQVQQNQQIQKRPASLMQLLDAKILHPGTDVLSFASSGDVSNRDVLVSVTFM